MTVRPEDDTPSVIGPKDNTPSTGQRIEHARVRVSVHVACTHRDESDPGRHRIEKAGRAARSAAVVSDFQYVGSKQASLVIHEPLLLRRFGVPSEEEAHVADFNAYDRAREVGIVLRFGPSRVGCEKDETGLVDEEGVSKIGRAHG